MARAIWSGAINFGLVSIPVRLYSATAPRRIQFHQIDRKSGARVRNKRVSERTGREVEYEDIVKGYEVADDAYVTVEPDELEAIEAETTHTVDIEDFVDLTEIDPVYYDATYYLAPGKGGGKAYALLLDAMESTGKAGIGRVVIRTKEHLTAIRPHDGALALHTMLFHDEIVSVSSIQGLPLKGQRLADREKKMARQLIDSLTTEFDAASYKDTYRARLEKLLEQKAKGKTITVEAPEEPPKVVDLIEALRRSVEESAPRKRTGARGGSRKRKSA